MDERRRDPNTIARGIAESCKHNGENGEHVCVSCIATALREYGEAKRQECLDEQKCNSCGCSYERCWCNPVREMEREAEGYRRGVEKAAKYFLNTYPACYRGVDSLLETLQRGTGGGE